MFSQRQRPVIYHPGTFHHRWKSHTSRPLKLVIDGDPGIDDCHAILIALASPHVQLLGITCVAGNTSVDNGVRNSHYLLHACQRHDVPVFRGASHSVDGQQYFKPHIHGEDGFGNITFNKTIPLDLLGRESAPEALVRLAHQYRGELVIAAIGPLTNLYWAHRLDPEFSRNIKRLYMMGGNFPMEIPGFRSDFSSYNFVADPTAASTVLEHFSTPKVLITSEMARFMALPMSFIENMFRYARNPTNKRAQLFHDVSQYFIGNRSTKRTKDPHRMFVSPDSVCLACVLDESVIIERKRVDGYVVPFGSNSAGHMTVNWTRQHQQHSNVDIVTKMDMEKFKVLFFRICLSS